MTAESLKSEGKASYDVGSRNVKEVVPQHTRDILAGGQEKSSDVLIWLPVDGCRDEEVFHCAAMVSSRDWQQRR